MRTTVPTSQRRAWRWRHTFALALVGLGLFAFAVTKLPAFGAAPEGAHMQALQASPQWRNGEFTNRQTQWLNLKSALWNLVFGPGNPNSVPTTPVAVVATSASELATLPPSGLRITWFGHSSSLVELDGVRVLTDPFWGERASPFGFIGPERWYAPPIALADLPPIDAVVISHDHYDHLDAHTIQAMREWPTRFYVPLGIGAHLQRWGIDASRIQELDWWQSAQVKGMTITATPSRHSSGRLSNDSNQTLWAGFALVGPQHRIWFSGDTGYHDDLAQIGQRLGPFDATLIEVGQYGEHWPDVHLGPELAVEANRQVRGRVMVPVHWALLHLAPHTWTEPIERVLERAACTQTAVRVLRPGEPTEMASEGAPPPSTPWWPQLPTQTAGQMPALATLNGDPAQRMALAPCEADKPAP